jgi:hypothetical protein
MIERRPDGQPAPRPAPRPSREERARIGRALDVVAAQNRAQMARERARRTPVAAVIDRVVGVNRARLERDRAKRRDMLEHFRREAARLRARGCAPAVSGSKSRHTRRGSRSRCPLLATSVSPAP